MSCDFSEHRRRWLDRIQRAEKKASLYENAIHAALDDIDEGETDVDKIKDRLLKQLQYAQTVA